jgi:hypothetical protein
MAKRFLVNVDLNNNNIINVADPSNATDAANKQYVDAALAGLKWKQEVRVATTANGTLATAFANGQSIDGVTLSTGDRILIKNQSTQTENGIYVVAASGSPARATDADSTAELNSATVFVRSGTVNADTAWTQTTDSPTVGSSNIVFAAFGAGGGTTYTADGQGIELTSTTFGLELDGSSLSKSASGLRIGSSAAGAGLTESSGILAVGAGTGITVNANDVALASTTAGAGLTHTTGVLAVGAGDGISVAADSVAVDSTVSRRFSTGTHASSTSIAITHSLGVQFCSGVSVYVTATGERVECDVTATSTTVMTFGFASAPTTNTLTFCIST